MRRYCGTGSISLTIAGNDARADHAECTFGAQTVSVDGGLLVYGARADLDQEVYIGLQVGRVAGSTSPPAASDGTYIGLVSARVHARSISLAGATVVLTGDRHRGSFRGMTSAGEAVEGQFSCRAG